MKVTKAQGTQGKFPQDKTKQSGRDTMREHAFKVKGEVGMIELGRTGDSQQ